MEKYCCWAKERAELEQLRTNLKFKRSARYLDIYQQCSTAQAQVIQGCKLVVTPGSCCPASPLRRIKSLSNSSDALSDTFFLVGIPGLEPVHIWISIPFCSMYFSALLGNSILIVIITIERSLHKPMYIYLSVLSVTDLALSSTTVPKMLQILWFGDGGISFGNCLTQMFFIHTVFALESFILLAMAFDHYMAICHPLRYASVLTPQAIGKTGIIGIIRSMAVVSPLIFLLKRMWYCGHRLIPHTYCEHMGIARLACSDITLNVVYGLTVAFLTIGLDIVLIAASYILILCAVFRLPSQKARRKALNTCGSHLCTILIFYIPAFFSFLTHCFGHHIPPHIHILLANLYVLVPPMLNPIVYGVNTKEIRKQVLKIFLLRRGEF
ncbi:olfactory receptor 52D1-like [Tachyglossus aculeatus]|uniref:olfactory receptor 52D1-like n=1 Tax=Tachyglossus aculeatus TaxID=9261 RepID=UPI0018F5F004|nr:olfactory receptor 52D1-like [Tachyglossus aculeatus]